MRNITGMWLALGAAIGGTTLSAAGMLIMPNDLGIPTNSSTMQPSTAPATAPAVMTDEQWKVLQDQLLGQDVAAQAQAVASLEQIPATRLDGLRGVAAALQDDSVKSLVHARILEIKQELAVHPLPLTFELHQATRYEAKTALLQLTGQNVDPAQRPPATNPPDRYDYSGHDQPYWDIFRALAAQGDIFKDGAQPALGKDNFQVAGPFMISITQITQSSSVVFVPARPPSTSMSSQLLVDVAADPRVRVAGFVGPEITEVTDDTGASLLQENNAGVIFGGGFRQRGMQQSTQQHWTGSTQLILAAPPRAAKKIASLKGSAIFQVPVNDEVEIADVQNHLNVPVKIVGASMLTVKTFSTNNGGLQMQITAAPNIAVINRNGGLLTLFDGKQRPVFQQQFSGGGFNVSRNMPGIAGPFKLRLEWPVSVEEVEVPFEFKDLPLP